MSDNILSRDELDNLLLSWQKKYGEEYTSRKGNLYYRVTDLRTAMNALVNTFISIGYDKENLKSSDLSKQIQRSLTPSTYDEKRLKAWRDQLDKQWKSTLNDFFPYEGIKEAKILDPIKKPEIFLDPPKIEPVREDSAKKKKEKREPITEPMAINEQKGFGRITDIMTDENILAGIDEANDE